MRLRPTDAHGAAHAHVQAPVVLPGKADVRVLSAACAARVPCDDRRRRSASSHLRGHGANATADPNTGVGPRSAGDPSLDCECNPHRARLLLEWYWPGAAPAQRVRERFEFFDVALLWLPTSPAAPA